MSQDDAAILSWELSETRKDLRMFRVRILVQVRAGNQPKADALTGEYQKTVRKYRRLLDLSASVALPL
jgi:hypothetical protein